MKISDETIAEVRELRLADEAAREARRARTDTERLDFLNAQGFTRWVGYGTPKSNCTWPVFPGQDLREQIDSAMDMAERRPR